MDSIDCFPPPRCWFFQKNIRNQNILNNRKIIPQFFSFTIATRPPSGLFYYFLCWGTSPGPRWWPYPPSGGGWPRWTRPTNKQQTKRTPINHPTPRPPDPLPWCAKTEQLKHTKKQTRICVYFYSKCIDSEHELVYIECMNTNSCIFGGIYID